MHPFVILVARSLLLIDLAFIASCGGGGDEEPANGGPVAYYSDPFYRDNRLLGLMVFHGGLLYGFYQTDFQATPNVRFAYAGFMVARRSSAIDPDSAYQGFDFDFERKSAVPVEVSLQRQPTDWYLGAVKPDGGTAEPFQAGYATVSFEPTQLGRLSNTYGGYMRSVNESAFVRASVDVYGNLSVSTEAGCAMAGTLKARPLGNLYDATLTVGASCAVPAGNYTGHALQSFNTTNVYLMVTTAGFEHGLFVHLIE